MAVQDKYMGLVLAGGRSSRMGSDKSLLNYNGSPQREHVRQLLSPLCERVFISVKKTGADDPDYFIADELSLGDIGPMGGILTAFRKFPHFSWIVAGCDYPFITVSAFQELQAAVTDNCLAVAFQNPETQRPEPLLTIYRPPIFPLIEDHFSTAKFSLQRLLEEVSATSLDPENQEWLVSVDTPEIAQKILRQQS